jgi:hypothetical protein
VHQPVPDVTDLRPEVPADLATVVATAMAKDPAARYPDAAAMRAALLGGPSAAPSPPRTAVLPAVSDTAPTEPLTTSTGASTPSRSGTPSWLLPAIVALVALVGLWWVMSALGLVGASDPDTPGVDVTQPEEPGDGGDTTEAPPAGEPEATEPEPTEPEDATTTEETGDGEPTDEEPTDEEPTDDETATEPPATAEPQTLDELILLLAASPTGTYGEKHGDLLEDLIELRDEQAPGQRAQEAAAIQAEVEDYVAAGELDREVGRVAILVLAEIASHTGN